MFYKQNSFSGRVSPSEAAAAYQPQGLGPAKQVKAGPVIEVTPMSNNSPASSAMSEIRKWQEIFQKAKAPVYLAGGTKDVVMFRGLSAVIGIGLGYTFYNMYLMATGRLKKKERS
ncbi:cytochrome c oxidase subunit 7A-related protein, mitochondrial-like [Acropora muricata]|uniref:cytochrome c oxidase subunit 7A-related protein, mitochondrial-like n=1 Tax=Acropora muricata TaxID=159855 RepID=UPI0034E5AEED